MILLASDHRWAAIRKNIMSPNRDRPDAGAGIASLPGFPLHHMEADHLRLCHLPLPDYVSIWMLPVQTGLRATDRNDRTRMLIMPLTLINSTVFPALSS